MNIYITKGARQYGYLIWNKKMDVDIDKMLVGLTAVDICWRKEH